MSAKPEHFRLSHAMEEPSDEIRATNLPHQIEEPTGGPIVLINSHSIILDCFARAMRLDLPQPIVCVPTVDQAISGRQLTDASLVVLCQIGLSRAEMIEQVSYLRDHLEDCPAAVLSDREDPDLIVEVLGEKIRGYIPTSQPLGVALQAMQLVRAGGVFVPASTFIAAQRSPREAPSDRFGNGIFTARQAAVVEALMRGKANKIIAYELNMKESTVKVHVRNIMKKLRATNRTEVAYIANRLRNGEEIAI